MYCVWPCTYKCLRRVLKIAALVHDNISDLLFTGTQEKSTILKIIFFLNYKTTNKPSKKKNFFVFRPIQQFCKTTPPPPYNQLTFYTRCLLQSTTQGFFKILLLKQTSRKKRKANHFKYKLSWVVRKHYHGNQNRTAFQRKKMMKGNKATIPGGKAVVVICQTSISIWSKKTPKNQHRFHFFPYSFMSNYASI